jgi:hypothetical protein
MLVHRTLDDPTVKLVRVKTRLELRRIVKDSRENLKLLFLKMESTLEVGAVRGGF